jgi:hypothetical protein
MTCNSRRVDTVLSGGGRKWRGRVVVGRVAGRTRGLTETVNSAALFFDFKSRAAFVIVGAGRALRDLAAS